MMKHYVFYTIDGSPKAKAFELKTECDDWVKQFLLDKQIDGDSNIDVIISGNLEYSECKVEEE